MLDYYTLNSPEAITLKNGVKIRPIFIKDIDKITYPVYTSYVGCLLLSPTQYFNTIEEKEDYFSAYPESEKNIILQLKKECETSDNLKNTLTIFELIEVDSILRNTFTNAFSFFFEDNIAYSKKHNMFIIYQINLENEDLIPIGQINKDNYEYIIDIILQLQGIERSIGDRGQCKTKNSIALEIFNKIKKGKEMNNKPNPSDKRMELGNIISAVSSRHPSINTINIRDMTVYQVYDQFKRLQLIDLNNMQSTSVSIWGDKKNSFKNDIWYQNI